MSDTLKAVQSAIELLTRMYESPSLATVTALPGIEVELARLNKALDDIQWIERGLAECRAEATAANKNAEAARATARIAIGHLQAVLNLCKTHAEQQTADTCARLWLQSIGGD